MNGCRCPLAALCIVVAVAASDPGAASAGEPAPGGAPSEPSVQVEPFAGQPAAPQPEPPAPQRESPATNRPPAPVPQPLAPAPAVVPAPGVTPALTTAVGERTVPTSPPPEARFSDAGQFVLDGALSASLGHTGFSAGGSTTSITIQPAFDYFAAPSFSVGASALLRYTDNEPSTAGTYLTVGAKTLTYGLTGAVGFNAWLGDRVSFWPRLSLGAWRTRATLSNSELVPANGAPLQVYSPVQTQTVVVVELFAPFLLHLTPHFFIGFGPELYADLHNSLQGMSNKRTFIGAASTVGGWF